MTTFLDGLSAVEIALLQERPRRRIPAGSLLLEQGDQPRGFYLVCSGTAEVAARDENGLERHLSFVTAGGTLGELSALTGRPVTATVRAVTELEVIQLEPGELEGLSERIPRLYRNVAQILSERLIQRERDALHPRDEKLTVLLDDGAPPLLGYALAASVAWHTRTPTVLVALGVEDERLDRLAVPWPALVEADAPAAARAHLVRHAATGPFAPDSLAATTALLGKRFEHVLLQAPARMPGRPNGRLAIRLAADGTAARGDGAEHVLAGLPALVPADAAALAAGLLPASTEAGRAVARLARRVGRLTVGLALGAGNSKGYAHVGALEALARLGVEADVLAGSSVGAAVAAAHAAGFPPAEIADVLDRMGALLLRPGLSGRSLLSSRALARGLRDVCGELRIEELAVPLAIVAADIGSGKEVVLRRGELWRALLGALSMPGLYPAQRVGPYALVDGGVLNSVPVAVAEELGADVVIAVRLGGARPAPDLDAEASAGRAAIPGVIGGLTRALELMQGKLSADAADAARVVLNLEGVELTGLELRNFSRGRRFLEAGQAAVEAASVRLAAALPWLADRVPA